MSQTRKPTTSPSRRQLLQQSLGGAVVLWLGPQQLAWGADFVVEGAAPAEIYTPCHSLSLHVALPIWMAFMWSLLQWWTIQGNCC